MKIPVVEALGYAVASGCALMFDMTILWIPVHFLGCENLVAATLSFLSGTFVACAMSVGFVFGRRRLSDPSAEFASFAALGAVGLGVNAAVMFVAVRYWGFYYLVAKGMAAAFTLACNFLTRRQLLFFQRGAP